MCPSWHQILTTPLPTSLVWSTHVVAQQWRGYCSCMLAGEWPMTYGVWRWMWLTRDIAGRCVQCSRLSVGASVSGGRACTSVAAAAAADKSCSIVDTTAACRDNNQSGVTSCDNFLPIRRVDRPADRLQPRPSTVRVLLADPLGLAGPDAGRAFDRCPSIMMMTDCDGHHLMSVWLHSSTVSKSVRPCRRESNSTRSRR